MDRVDHIYAYNTPRVERWIIYLVKVGDGRLVDRFPHTPAHSVHNQVGEDEFPVTHLPGGGCVHRWGRIEVCEGRVRVRFRVRRAR